MRCLTSPNATKEPEIGEPMPERNVHGVEPTNWIDVAWITAWAA
jgi:hypothetical protein